jgi:protein-S-isoprenylcysteine O-methyltransferase Ste14
MRRSLLGWFVVLLQLVLLAGAAAAPGPVLYTVVPALRGALLLLAGGAAVAAVVSLLGLGRALTASPVPREDGALATTGAYGIVRHPGYALLMVVAVLVAAASGNATRLLCALALTVLLSVKARWEERMLRARHADYPAYAARVPRFIPRLRR